MQLWQIQAQESLFQTNMRQCLIFGSISLSTTIRKQKLENRKSQSFFTSQANQDDL